MSHTPYEQFRNESAGEINAQASDAEFINATRAWMNRSLECKYSYHFEWLGRPVIQYPQDLVAMQELIWAVRPDLIVETGIAHGGSLIFSASMLALLDITDAIMAKRTIEPRTSSRKVIGIDIEMRPHNRAALEAHPMISRIEIIESSSLATQTVERVHSLASHYERVLICLDSNHTHEHVLAELEAYAPLTSVGSYCVVFDTIIEDMPAELSAHRPWGPGCNAKTAVCEYLQTHPEFESDRSIQDKLMITAAPGGYLRRLT